MPVLIQAHVKRSIGWAALKFAYNAKAKDAIKAFPGARWIDPEKDSSAFDDGGIAEYLKNAFDDGFVGPPKAWYVPASILPLIEEDKSNFKLEVIYDEPPRELEIPSSMWDRLKPFQQEDVVRCTQRPDFMLTYEPRVGKTPTAVTVACAYLANGVADLAIVLYPNSVAGEWERQPKEWANLDLVKLESLQPLLTMEVNALRSTPYLLLGCHHEILGHREKCIARVVDGRRYILIVDEAQQLKNRKSARFMTARRLSMGTPIIAEGELPEDDVRASGTCVARVLLTGTEMRNRPRDLFGVFDIALPGQMGGYWTYCKRFAGAFQDDRGHWNDKGKSNPEELRRRLQLVSHKVTRAEAAPWLPRMQRVPILCAVPEEMLSKYRALEKAYGKRIANALENDEPSAEDRVMIEEMDKVTSAAKMDVTIQRALEALDRGVKVRVSAHHHATAATFVERFESYFDESHPLRAFPHFIATGYISPSDRAESITRWKEFPSAALLITNNLSASVGIDLADAKVSICIEPEWVPSDQEQWEARAMDVHHGKTVEPPLIYYPLVRGTMDEAKVLAMLSKLGDIEEIVGKGTETSAMRRAFRESGVIAREKLPLENHDRSTIAAALRALRERALRGPDSREASLAAEMASWEDDEEIDTEEGE